MEVTRVAGRGRGEVLLRVGYEAAGEKCIPSHEQGPAPPPRPRQGISRTARASLIKYLVIFSEISLLRDKTLSGVSLT